MPLEIKRLSQKHKKSKIRYYLRNGFASILPNSIYHGIYSRKKNSYLVKDLDYILDRVNYYNKLESGAMLDSNSSIAIRDFKKPQKLRVYYYDLKRYLRYFNEAFRFQYLPGDIIHIPSYPNFLKSRPIHGDNSNSVLMKLNEIRHFIFIDKDIPYHQKCDRVVWRGKVDEKKQQRIELLSSVSSSETLDFGMVNHDFGKDKWHKNRLTITEQLSYKFILSVEGNDVATNLKWILSSNSLCMMCKPKYETWFMEGRLIPNVHYIEIKSDFSDIEEKMNYYLSHPSEALKILENAHRFTEQFRDVKRENYISKCVVEKYFEKTAQFE